MNLFVQSVLMLLCAGMGYETCRESFRYNLPLYQSSSKDMIYDLFPNILLCLVSFLLFSYFDYLFTKMSVDLFNLDVQWYFDGHWYFLFGFIFFISYWLYFLFNFNIKQLNNIAKHLNEMNKIIKS